MDTKKTCRHCSSTDTNLVGLCSQCNSILTWVGTQKTTANNRKISDKAQLLATKARISHDLLRVTALMGSLEGDDLPKPKVFMADLLKKLGRVYD